MIFIFCARRRILRDFYLFRFDFGYAHVYTVISLFLRWRTETDQRLLSDAAESFVATRVSERISAGTMSKCPVSVAIINRNRVSG